MSNILRRLSHSSSTNSMARINQNIISIENSTSKLDNQLNLSIDKMEAYSNNLCYDYFINKHPQVHLIHIFWKFIKLGCHHHCFTSDIILRLNPNGFTDKKCKLEKQVKRR